MDIAEKLPTMADGPLAMLQANATRLSTRGTPAQRAAADALLPKIIAEQAGRVATKPVKTKGKAATTRRTAKADPAAPAA